MMKHPVIMARQKYGWLLTSEASLTLMSNGILYIRLRAAALSVFPREYALAKVATLSWASMTRGKKINMFWSGQNDYSIIRWFIWEPPRPPAMMWCSQLPTSLLVEEIQAGEPNWMHWELYELGFQDLRLIQACKWGGKGKVFKFDTFDSWTAMPLLAPI